MAHAVWLLRRQEKRLLPSAGAVRGQYVTSFYSGPLSFGGKMLIYMYGMFVGKVRTITHHETLVLLILKAV